MMSEFHNSHSDNDFLLFCCGTPLAISTSSPALAGTKQARGGTRATWGGGNREHLLGGLLPGGRRRRAGAEQRWADSAAGPRARKALGKPPRRSFRQGPARGPRGTTARAPDFPESASGKHRKIVGGAGAVAG